MNGGVKISLLLAGLACLSSPAMAQTAPEPGIATQEALRSAAEQIMNGVRLMIQAIPQYEAPVMLENGDILIRRKHPAPADEPAPDKDAPSEL